MCHSLAKPLVLEYSHIGDTTIRLGSVTSRMGSGSNRLGISVAPWLDCSIRMALWVPKSQSLTWPDYRILDFSLMILPSTANMPKPRWWMVFGVFLWGVVLARG